MRGSRSVAGGQSAGSRAEGGQRRSAVAIGWSSAGRSLNGLMARDKVSLDLFLLRDESLEDTDNLPPPAAIAAEIVEDLEAALAEFADMGETLGRLE